MCWISPYDISLLQKAYEQVGIVFEYREGVGPGIYEDGGWCECNPLESTLDASNLCDDAKVRYWMCEYGCCDYFEAVVPPFLEDIEEDRQYGEDYWRERRAAVEFIAAKAKG